MGSGSPRYRAVEEWGELPDGWRLGEVAAVAVDRHDRVFVFHRGPHPLLVFDKWGRLLDHWGDEAFVRPHGLHIAPDDRVYCTDEGDHSVRKYSPEGKLLLKIGGDASPYQSGRPFHRCTHTALAPVGDIYVTDGYGNARVHRYSPDGRLLGSWGSPGSGPGEFNLPHNIVCDADGWVYVADRENHRIQVFDGSGRYETQWNNLHRPSALFLRTSPAGTRFYVGEIGAYLESNRRWPNVGPRVSVLSATGELIERIDSEVYARTGPGSFVSPHGVAVDSAGDLYVGDVCFSSWPSLFPGTAVPDELSGLHKFTADDRPQCT